MSYLLPHHKIVPFGPAMLNNLQVLKNHSDAHFFAFMHGFASSGWNAFFFLQPFVLYLQ